MNWKEWTALLYPSECPVCQKLLSDTEDRRRHIHGDCYRKLRRIVEPMCKRCGKPLLSAQQEYCYDCQRRPSACEAGTQSVDVRCCSVQRVYLLISMTERELIGFLQSGSPAFLPGLD